MPESKDINRELQLLESDLRKLEGEYNMYFSGRLPRPPWETRSRLEASIKRLDRSVIQNYGERFRFTTIQSRFAAFVDLWDRGLRAREEGRPGPFKQRPPAEVKKAPVKAVDKDKVLFAASFKDPMKEMDKLQDLYDTLRDAREQRGEQQHAVPQVHRAGEGAGVEVEERRRARSRVSCRAEGWKAELYGERSEGREVKQGRLLAGV